METEAIILAGGQGTRLKSVVPDLPKPLAEVNGRPFLDILLSQLARAGCVSNVVLAVGYKGEMIIERYCLNPDFPFSIHFSEEKEPLGTGGAAVKASRLTFASDLILMNGDSYVEAGIERLLAFHKAHGAPFSMVLREVDDGSRYGSVTMDRKGRITGFREKESSTGRSLINAGVYVIKRELLDSLAFDAPASLEKDMLPCFMASGGYGYKTDGRFIDIGIPETYRAAGEYLRGII